MAVPDASSPSFASFYRTTLDALRRYLYHMVGSQEDAQDLAHDAYLRVHAAMHGGHVEKPQAFLYTTARRLAINSIKRRDNGPIDPGSGDVLDVAPCEAPSVERIVIARQEWERIERALAALPHGCRNVLLLRKLQHLSHEEIARRLGISRSTVEKQLARALRLLRASLQAQDEAIGAATDALGKIEAAAERAGL